MNSSDLESTMASCYPKLWLVSTNKNREFPIGYALVPIAAYCKSIFSICVMLKSSSILTFRSWFWCMIDGSFQSHGGTPSSHPNVHVDSPWHQPNPPKCHRGFHRIFMGFHVRGPKDLQPVGHLRKSSATIKSHNPIFAALQCTKLRLVHMREPKRLSWNPARQPYKEIEEHRQ